jgi:hypothetical protein
MLSFGFLDVDPEAERKSSAHVIARRAHFQQIVTAVVGAIWICCQVAAIQAAVRALLFD